MVSEGVYRQATRSPQLLKINYPFCVFFGRLDRLSTALGHQIPDTHATSNGKKPKFPVAGFADQKSPAISPVHCKLTTRIQSHDILQIISLACKVPSRRT